MDKDRVVGSAKQVKGAVKQAVGNAVGDAKLESEGQADQVEGKVQNAIGGFKGACVQNGSASMSTKSSFATLLMAFWHGDWLR